MSTLARDDEPADDVDRLFLKLEPLEPPPDFASSLVARAYARPVAAAGRGWLWWTFDAVALVLLLVLSISFGMALHESGTVDILAVTLEVGAVGEAVDALFDSLPWLQLAALAIDAGLVLFLSRLALGSGAPWQTGPGPASPSPRAA